MFSKTFLNLGCATLSAAACAVADSAAPAAPAAPRPNILFFFADDMRADTIAALGNTNIQTPNLDRLARRGLAFNRAYMQGACRGATCVPSRAMLLSGQGVFRIDEQLLRDQTWPTAFGKAGYSTFISGKWHNGEKSLPLCFQQARSVFVGGMTDNPLHATLRDLKDGRLTKLRVSTKHACAVFADEGVRFLGKHKEKDGPFFCYLPFDAPHDPHIVPPNYPVHYDPAKLVPPNFLPQHPFDNGEMEIRDEKLLPHPRTKKGVGRMNAEYYRYISWLDTQIGRVLDALDASPYAKNTIVVFSADSGVARGSHGLIGKQNLYDYDSVRVPLIIAGPGIPENQRTEAMCYLFDVLPTLGSLCQVPAPPKSQGLDFSPVLHDPGRAARTDLFFAYKGVQRAVATSEWKLIWYPRAKQTQLFNLKDDPDEIHNLADQPGQAAKVAEMFALLKKKMAEVDDDGNEWQNKKNQPHRSGAMPAVTVPKAPAAKGKP